MPNLFYMFVSFVYHAALALWVGGAIALGAFAAPVLFGGMPRPQAGSLFGPILRRFSRARVVAIALAIGASAVKAAVWERHAASPWIAARWALLTLLCAVVLYEVLSLEKAIRAAAPPSGESPSPRFTRLHRRSEMLMKLSLAAALGAIFLA